MQPRLYDKQRCVDWSGQRIGFVRLKQTSKSLIEADKANPLSDTLHTSAYHIAGADFPDIPCHTQHF